MIVFNITGQKNTNLYCHKGTQYLCKLLHAEVRETGSELTNPSLMAIPHLQPLFIDF